MYTRCCGLDVHKKSITSCVLLRDAAGATQQEIRRFGTMTRDLLELTNWLHGLQVTYMAMASTAPQESRDIRFPD